MSGSGHLQHVDHCLNCGAPTPGEFCAECGQEAVNADVRFRDLVAHFVEEVVGLEARLPQTMRLLFTRPGELTRAYNSGQRVRFVTPLKLYLFASVAFFLVASFSASRAQTDTVATRDESGHGFTVSPRPQKSVVRMNVKNDAGESVAVEFHNEQEVDAWFDKPENTGDVPAFLRPHMRALTKDPRAFQSSILDMMSKATLALVPIHALLLRLLYWRPRRFYGEHVIFSFHLHAFAYLLFGFATLVGTLTTETVTSVSETIALVGGGIYSVLAARTAYGQGLARSALKMTVAGVGYVIALGLVVAIASSVAFFLA